MDKQKVENAMSAVKTLLEKEGLELNILDVSIKGGEKGKLYFNMTAFDFGNTLKNILEKDKHLREITAMTIGYLCRGKFRGVEMPSIKADIDLIKYLINKLD